MTKPITSELGCVTPVIVVPGIWSEAELAFQARHIAGMVTHNASFNCAAAKVIITANSWAQRDAFWSQLRQELAQTPARVAYYPGAQERYQAFLAQYPQAIVLKPSDEPMDNAVIPWTVIPGVPANAGEYALTQEAFCGVLADVSLDAANTGAFLAKAVDLVNEQIWGNLSCTLLVDSQTQAQWSAEVEIAIDRLRYGAIGVNVWSGVIFSLGALPWGAFPENSLEAIASGCGVVHNAYLFEQPQKAVLRAPFRLRPLPLWFPRHPNLLRLAQHFTNLQATLSWRHFLRVVLAAVRAGS